MWAVHAFKKDNTNKGDYFPNSSVQFRIMWVARAYLSSSGARWDPVLFRTTCPYLCFHTCSLRVGDLRHLGSLSCTCLGPCKKLEPLEKTCRYWEKVQTPRSGEVPPVGIDFLFPSHQHYPPNKVEGNNIIPGPAVLILEWSSLSALYNILNLVNPLTFLKPNSTWVK